MSKFSGIQFEQALTHCVEEARTGNPESHSIISALGEIKVGGVAYQMQIQLIAEKKLWIRETDVVRSEIVKVHDPAPGYKG